MNGQKLSHYKRNLSIYDHITKMTTVGKIINANALKACQKSTLTFAANATLMQYTTLEEP